MKLFASGTFSQNQEAVNAVLSVVTVSSEVETQVFSQAMAISDELKISLLISFNVKDKS